MESSVSVASGELLKAIHFAAQKHRNQRRKDPGKTPYINHPLEVVHLLYHHGHVRDLATLIAGVLHDTLEDTDACVDDIQSLFGSEVCGIVQEVTDDNSLEYLTRKSQQIESAPQLSPKAKLVRLADKICNTRDIHLDPPDNWSLKRQRAYFLWAQRVVDGIRGINPALEAIFDDVQQQFHKKNGEQKA